MANEFGANEKFLSLGIYMMVVLYRTQWCHLIDNNTLVPIGTERSTILVLCQNKFNRTHLVEIE